MSRQQSKMQGLDFEQIKQIIPQRFPFLMLDRVTNVEPGVRVVGIKNLTGNEWFYQGHFPVRAVTPGAMICEAVAQTGIIFLNVSQEVPQDVTYLMSGLKMRFVKPATPGDQLVIEVTPIKVIFGAAMLLAHVRVEGETIARGEIGLVAKRNG